MAWLPAVMALAFAVSLPALRPHRCKGFVSGGLRFGPRTFLVVLHLGATILQLIYLFADVVDEGFSVDSRSGAKDASRGEDCRGEAC